MPRRARFWRDSRRWRKWISWRMRGMRFWTRESSFRRWLPCWPDYWRTRLDCPFLGFVYWKYYVLPLVISIFESNLQLRGKEGEKYSWMGFALSYQYPCLSTRISTFESLKTGEEPGRTAELYDYFFAPQEKYILGREYGIGFWVGKNASPFRTMKRLDFPWSGIGNWLGLRRLSVLGSAATKDYASSNGKFLRRPRYLSTHIWAFHGRHLAHVNVSWNAL